VLVERDYARFGPVTKIERNVCLSRVEGVNPGLAVASGLNVVGLAIHGENLRFGHADLWTLFLLLLLNRFCVLVNVAGASRNKNRTEDQPKDGIFHENIRKV